MDTCVPVQRSFKELEQILSLRSHPRTEDRTQTPRKTQEQKVALVVLGSPQKHFDLLLEGGECCPGDAMLVLSPSWLEKVPGCQEDKKRLLLVIHQAVTFSKGGYTYVDVFKPPRRVTYVINTMEEEFDTSDVDVAVNGSTETAEILTDPLRLKTEMSGIGMSVPRGLVLQSGLGTKEHPSGYKVYNLGERNEDADILAILQDLKAQQNNRIIYKVYFSCIRTGCHSSSISKATADEVLSLIRLKESSMKNGDYFLIEAIDGFELKKNDEKVYEVLGHVTVCRGLDDQLMTSEVTSTINRMVHTCQESDYHTLETTFRDLGVKESAVRSRLREDVRSQAKVIMERLIALENRYNGSYIGPRTDFIELTFNISNGGGSLTATFLEGRLAPLCPYVREDEPWTRTPNPAARLVLHVMVMRSHSLMLRGKWFLIISRGVKGRLDFWAGMKKYGAKVAVVTLQPITCYSDTIDLLVVYDFYDSSHDDDHARNIIAKLDKNVVQVSGGFVTQDFHMNLLTKVLKHFGIQNHSYDAGDVTNFKALTYNAVWNSPARRFTSRGIKAENKEMLHRATKETGFPVFMKFDAGGGGRGAAKLNNEEECLAHYEALQHNLQDKPEQFEISSESSDVVLTEYIDGSEHNVEIVMFHGELIVAYIRDVAPVLEPSFVPTANVVPSGLPKDKRNTLIHATHQCCLAVGLRDGVYNVEMRLTAEGPKLLEINARIAAYAIIPLIKRCYDEDLTMLYHLTNCGIRPTMVHLPPLRQAYTLLLRNSQHLKQLSAPWVTNLLEDLNRRDVVMYRWMRPLKMTCYDSVLAVLGIIDEDGEKAKGDLLALANTLGFDTPGYPCAQLFKLLG